MQGKIVIYYPQIGSGAIQTEEGEQYIFTRADWAASGETPKLGQTVSFEPGERLAKNVVMAEALRVANDKGL
jgi:cold shock CspA family protein